MQYCIVDAYDVIRPKVGYVKSFQFSKDEKLPEAC